MMRRITRKTTSLRRAVAHARVRASAATIDRVRSNETSKRDVLAVARVAAISAAKKTSDLIPYCHPVPVESVDVSFELEGDVIDIAVQVEAVARTGLEMEALTAASVAALTIYDMLKPDDRHMVIENVHLEFKQGGRSDPANARVPDGFTAAVVVASDGVSRGERQDHSGAAIVERLRAWGIEASLCVVPDDREVIVRTLRERVERRTDLVITTGGTGLGPRDVTVDATRDVIERDLPGVSEAVRAHGQARNARAMLSRGAAGVCGRTMIVNLPGSISAVEDGLDALLPGLFHAFEIMRGGTH